MTRWHNKSRAPQVKSYTDRLLEQIWGCIAALIVLSAILVLGYDTRTIDPLFPALLLIGAGLFISGQVIRNKYMYYASCIVVPIGFGITRDSWLNADPDYNLLQFAAASSSGSRVPASAQAAGKARCGRSGENRGTHGGR